MGYTFTFWRGITAEQATTTRAIRPGCVGSFTARRAVTCHMRPDHVVSYWTNPSRLPGQGEEHVHAACYRHVHGLLAHAYAVSTGPVTVSPYKGV